MTELVQASEKELYLSDLKKVEAVAAPAWLKRIREAGATRFGELEFPHRKMEQWRFTNVGPIVGTRFASNTEPSAAPNADAVKPLLFGEEGWTELVFVDGFYSAALSRLGELPRGVRAGSLAEAVAKGDALVEAHLSRYAGVNGNIFSALNAAFIQDGAFVHVPADVVVEQPIHLLFVSTARPDTASYPRNLVVLERQAEAQIIETYASLADGRYFTNAVTELALGEGANLKRYGVQREAREAYHLSTVKAHQERSSVFTSYAVSMGAKIGRNELISTLDGEGAECSLNGVYMVDGDQLIDNATSIEHMHPHGTSWIGYKGILDDKASAVFSGQIYVARDAQKTDSKQLNNNLLLSDTATINTKPLLEIYADDVKCTHGATVGPPPEEIIFYFQTRGMSAAMARGMLTYGFAGEIVNAIGVKPLRDRLDKFVYDRYSP
ncbi:MAG: Fe-S cluster assembly protein SufD [FCB group bacterium]|jgi:Fe-S cluster assembly protein SufD|nr:Fe-S cluster assembly protein SufD [FCB group bacterium]